MHFSCVRDETVRSGRWRAIGKQDFQVGLGLKVLATALFRYKEAGPLGKTKTIYIYTHTDIYTYSYRNVDTTEQGMYWEDFLRDKAKGIINLH